MKRLDLSNTSTTVGLLPTSGIPAFLQDSFTEITANALIGMIGNSYSSSTPFILFGCIATVGSPNTTVSAGAIFLNGEVYTVPAKTFTSAAGGNVILCTLNVANNYLEPDGITAADPANYDDLSTHNTFDIRTISFTTGASGGSGTAGYLFDFSATLALPDNSFTQSGVIFGLIGGVPASPSTYFGYKKRGLNEIQLSGSIGGNSGSSGPTVVATLPFPPLETQSIPAVVSQTGGSTTIQVITIDTSGNITVNISSSIHPVSVSLSGISYRSA